MIATAAMPNKKSKRALPDQHTIADPDRSIRVFGEINAATIDQLTQQILCLKAASSNPIRKCLDASLRSSFLPAKRARVAANHGNAFSAAETFGVPIPCSTDTFVPIRCSLLPAPICQVFVNNPQSTLESIRT